MTNKHKHKHTNVERQKYYTTHPVPVTTKTTDVIIVTGGQQNKIVTKYTYDTDSLSL